MNSRGNRFLNDFAPRVAIRPSGGPTLSVSRFNFMLDSAVNGIPLALSTFSHAQPRTVRTGHVACETTF